MDVLSFSVRFESDAEKHYLMDYNLLLSFFLLPAEHSKFVSGNCWL
jgi:hypothetical protein